MISKTEAICLNYIKYKEASIIVRLFTRESGLQSFIVNSVRSQKAKRKLGFFEPFNLLEVVYYQSKNADIHRVSEYRIKKAHHEIRFNTKKAAITMFLTEFLGKVLANEQIGNDELYDFLCQEISRLDETLNGFENFHLQTLLGMTAFLGFSYDPSTMHLPESSHAIDEFVSNLIYTESNIPTTGKIRTEALTGIIKYYRIHTGQSLDIKSLAVLQSVFS